MPEIIHAYVPLTTTRTEFLPAGQILGDYMSKSMYDQNPVVCSINGAPVFRKDWQTIVITDDDDVVVVHLPQGGGSDPARTVMTIAVIAISIYAPYAAGIANTPLGGLLAAGIQVGGALLINAVMPIRQTDPTQYTAKSAASSTYSLSSPTNMPRLGQPVPWQCGRVETTPPQIAKPWSEYVDDIQYTYILLCLGTGLFDIEKLKFDTISFDDVPSVEYHVLEPGETVPWHDNVFTSPHVSGQEIYRTNSFTSVTQDYPVQTDRILCSPTWIADLCVGDSIILSGSTNNTGVYTIKLIDYDLPTAYVYVKETPLVAEVFRGNIQTAYDYKITDFYPAYPDLNKPTFGCHCFCDVVFPNGLFTMEDDGTISPCTVDLTIMSRKIYMETGDLTESFELEETVSITRCQRTPVRVTLEGQFNSLLGYNNQVAIKRAAASISNKKIDTCYWTALRTRFTDIGSYPWTTIQIKAAASEGLSGDALNKIRVLSTRKLPIWSGTSWSVPTATRSIAWAAAEAAKDTDNSVGLADPNIDLDALLALDAKLTARGDYCDGVFDTKEAFWDALRKILRTGRSQPHLIGDIITFTRDERQSIVKGVFNTRNIVRGSFRVEYLMYDPDTPDDVIIEYFSSSTWDWRKRTCSLPGSSSDAPATIKLWGVTEVGQATNEGMYEAGCNMYRRAFVSFQTEMDARPILRGDLISVTHPLPSWGVSGDVVSVSGQILGLSEPVEFTTGNHYISFRKANGTQDGPYLCTAGADDYHVILSSAVPSTVYTGRDRERTHFQFGQGSDYEKRCLTVYRRPRGDKIEVLAVVEDDRVHTADGTVV